ncbi:benzoate/H(+) symporter BenE family transporter [Mangrovicoccus ximenensis]|uniref:benzoate/H(+) symporter BenE family transporter n=1 Tax=Mangrovicoccus ximenensis TaxID=1911570 RepID=UPI000D351588|nr:benzoate/H(+) symporter BenE family transporter [Mangrovicoccus ximenensis]
MSEGFRIRQSWTRARAEDVALARTLPVSNISDVMSRRIGAPADLRPMHGGGQMAGPLPIVLAWLAGWCFARRYAVLIAVAVTVAVVAMTTDLPPGAAALSLPAPEFVRPVLDLVPALGIAVPLFIVTMASQNVPGLAVLRSNGYTPATGEMFVSTGLASMGAALMGGHGLNLAAISPPGKPGRVTPSDHGV